MAVSAESIRVESGDRPGISPVIKDRKAATPHGRQFILIKDHGPGFPRAKGNAGNAQKRHNSYDQIDDH